MWKTIKQELKLHNFLFHYERPYHFYTSTIDKPRHFYLCWTIFWFLFHFGGLLTIFIHATPPHVERLLTYATILGYMFLTTVSLIDLTFVVLFQYVWPTSRQEKHQHGMPWYFKANWFISGLVYNSSLFITIAFWSLLFNANGPGNLGINIVEHAINSVYTLLNIFVTNKPIRILHFWTLILGLTIYIIYLGIYYSAGGLSRNGRRYIYFFLDFEHPARMTVYVLGMFLAIPLVNLLVFSLHRTRLWLVRKYKSPGHSKDDLTSSQGNLEVLA